MGADFTGPRAPAPPASFAPEKAATRVTVIVLNARKGYRFRVLNRGEDVQTFTEVEEFGGGIVQTSTNWFAPRR